MKFLINFVIFIISFFSLSLFFMTAINNFHDIFIRTGYLQGISCSSLILSVMLIGFSLFWMIVSFFGSVGK